jgi:hypothetical protein
LFGIKQENYSNEALKKKAKKLQNHKNLITFIARQGILLNTTCSFSESPRITSKGFAGRRNFRSRETFFFSAGIQIHPAAGGDPKQVPLPP